MVLVHWGGFEYSSSGIIPGLFSYSFFFFLRTDFVLWLGRFLCFLLRHIIGVLCSQEMQTHTWGTRRLKEASGHLYKQVTELNSD